MYGLLMDWFCPRIRCILYPFLCKSMLDRTGLVSADQLPDIELCSPGLPKRGPPFLNTFFFWHGEFVGKWCGSQLLAELRKTCDAAPLLRKFLQTANSSKIMCAESSMGTTLVKCSLLIRHRVLSVRVLGSKCVARTVGFQTWQQR